MPKHTKKQHRILWIENMPFWPDQLLIGNIKLEEKYRIWIIKFKFNPHSITIKFKEDGIFG